MVVALAVIAICWIFGCGTWWKLGTEIPSIVTPYIYVSADWYAVFYAKMTGNEIDNQFLDLLAQGLNEDDTTSVVDPITGTTCDNSHLHVFAAQHWQKCTATPILAPELQGK